MRTDCNAALFEFPAVEGHHVVASFDGGTITSDAGALLLGQTDRAIRLTERFASCFADARTAELVEHQVETLVMQRIVGIALGYEDLNDHDYLRHDPVLAVLANKLEAQRSDCAAWRTESRSVSWICSPIARQPRPCKPISCVCGLPRWPTCCSARCAVSAWHTASSPKRPAVPSG